MIFKIFYAVSRTVSNLTRRIYWLTCDSRQRNESYFKVHLLLVANSVYAKLAKTCVESFLHYHPNAHIVIHCDSNTKHSVFREFKILKLFRRSSFSIVEVEECAIWQLHKLKLILGMSGTTDIYMDCDLRWNGSIGDDSLGKIVFFVEERLLFTYDGLLEALPKSITKYSNTSMKNTSYFTWSGIKIESNQNQRIINNWLEMQDILALNLTERASSISRISEQVIIGLIPEILKIPFKFLKESDKQFDGSICESSYYGASGGRFAIWGDTLRRSFL